MVVRVSDQLVARTLSAFDSSRSSNEPSLLPPRAMTTNHTSKAIERRIEDEFRYYWKSRRKRKLNFEEKTESREIASGQRSTDVSEVARRVNEIPSERPGGGTCCIEGNRKRNLRAERWRLPLSGVWFQVDEWLVVGYFVYTRPKPKLIEVKTLFSSFVRRKHTKYRFL